MKTTEEQKTKAVLDMAGADLAEPERCSYKHSVLDDNGAPVICYHRHGCENCEYNRRCEKL
jgi:hypothetical protein